MPFKSKAQRRYMHKNLPKIAKRWEREYVKEVLPDRLAPKRKRKK
jgi:hypothetical protein|tara:strand:+ start:2536 stop:2670 length:135 start_codon:yes stop_codon:yes gene_type:complete